jgi:hypothetical protein
LPGHISSGFCIFGAQPIKIIGMMMKMRDFRGISIWTPKGFPKEFFT